MAPTVDVAHFTDPGCPWAYSAGPALAVLRWRYGAQLRWRLVTIGLAERHEQYAERGYTPGRSAIGRIAFRRFGMPLAPAVRTRLMGTARGCRAIVATRLLDPDREHAAFRALQFGWFTTDALMDTAEGVRGALEHVPGLDVDAVVAAHDSEEVRAAYEADRAEARTAAGTPTEAQGKAAATDGPVRYTAPSLVFRQGERCLEAGGFQSIEAYDVCLANLDVTLERRGPAGSPAEALEAFPEGLTTQEVAAVMTPDLAPVDRDGAEAALLAAQADGIVDRRPLGDDALWTPR
jgi:protein-disulfide isomerase-like protein with CxxC motif